MQTRRWFLFGGVTSPFSAMSAAGVAQKVTEMRKALKLMRSISTVLCVLLLTANALQADETHHHVLSEKEVGSVHFANSCSKAAQTSFQRAVALPHSFQYEQARAVFNDVSRQDSHCAMALWGVAMSHYTWNTLICRADESAMHGQSSIR